MKKIIVLILLLTSFCFAQYRGYGVGISLTKLLARDNTWSGTNTFSSDIVCTSDQIIVGNSAVGDHDAGFYIADDGDYNKIAWDDGVGSWYIWAGNLYLEINPSNKFIRNSQADLHDKFDLDAALWETGTASINIDSDQGSAGNINLGGTSDNDTTDVIGLLRINTSLAIDSLYRTGIASSDSLIIRDEDGYEYFFERRDK